MNQCRKRIFSCIILLAVVLFLTGCGSDEELLTADTFEENADLSDDIESVAGLSENNSNDGYSISNPKSVYVHICGEITNPGVYELKEGSRIYELVNLAGGLTPYASRNYLNQAESVTDGQKIYIPSEQETEQGLVDSQDSEMKTGIGIASNGKVNINTASKEDLMTITGIGETRAESIITYRQDIGVFQKIEDIMNVSGIKEGLYSKIKDQITT